MSKQAPISLSHEESNQLLDRLLNPGRGHQNLWKCRRNYLAGVLMLDAGLRIGEVVQLLVTDLTFNNASCNAVRIRPEISKTHLERTIPATTRLKNAITQLIPCWTVAAHNVLDCHAIVNATTHKPLTIRQLERIIGHAAYSAFGHKIHPHQLRHTFATRLMRVTSTRIVQTLLGHKSLSSTQIYTHPTETDRIDAIAKME